MTEHTELLTCREIVRLITAYLEDALPLAERLRFEEHLSICDGCTAYLDQMRMLIRVAGDVPEEELDEPLKQGLLRAFADWKRGNGDA